LKRYASMDSSTYKSMIEIAQQLYDNMRAREGGPEKARVRHFDSRVRSVLANSYLQPRTSGKPRARTLRPRGDCRPHDGCAMQLA
jgi:hypothetical protein